MENSSSILAGILARPSGTKAGESEGQRSLSRLMERMFEGGADLTMRSRLSDAQIQAALLAVATARFVGYKPLEEAAFILLELVVSRDGGGRAESTQLARAVYEASKESDNPPSGVRDAALG